MDMKTKYLVSGYIRNAHNNMIPQLIHHICAIFYWLSIDEWDENLLDWRFLIINKYILQNNHNTNKIPAFCKHIITSTDESYQ